MDKENQDGLSSSSRKNTQEGNTPLPYQLCKLFC